MIRDRGKIEKTQQQKEKTATSNKKEKKMAMLAINFPHAATATPFFSLSPFCRFLSFPRSSPPPPRVSQDIGAPVSRMGPRRPWPI